ncbi:hypothetical protein GC101_22020 [Paenibacillus sp. LMG 31459]|uniref:ABC transporter permease n=1 Tax=Paenibacillus phytohabitans TaxID=2654978 RepID=A0ABX1YKZ9_9BACL|nr:hypothetical protein [Paenibacillus phytohabitans]NOU81543.1 hypothetical protein [Paenibacillus phytohabitans]
MQNKVFEWAYRHFAKFSIKAFLRRLPYYAGALIILMIWGVTGLMFTFFVIMAFVVGWYGKALKAAVADYRLAKRLEKVYFTQIEFETMKRERDMAMQAYMTMRDERGRGVKVAGVPPMPPGPRHNTVGPDQINEFIAQFEGEQR